MGNKHFINQEWDIRRLDEVAQIESGGTPSTSDINNFNGDIPWITPKDLSNTYKPYISQGERSLSEQGLKKSSAKLLPKGTVLLTSRAPVGLVTIAANPLTTNQGFKNLIPKEGTVSEYLFYSLQHHKDILIQNSSGSTFQELSGSELKKIRLPFPSRPTQQKIATILSTVDQYIKKTDQIIQKTEELKKGLMQQLFTKGIGHTKFKKTKLGMIPEEWEVVELLKLISIKHGLAFKGEYFSDKPTENILLTPVNFKLEGGFNRTKIKYYYGPIPRDYLITPGTLIINMTDLTREGNTLGNPAILPHIHNKKFLHNQRLGKVKILSDQLLNNFLFYRLCYKDYKKIIIDTATGTTVKHTSPSKITAFIFALPRINEQKKITEILSKVDDKINKNKDIKEKLLELKKGLMQDLFNQ